MRNANIPVVVTILSTAILLVGFSVPSDANAQVTVNQEATINQGVAHGSNCNDNDVMSDFYGCASADISNQCALIQQQVVLADVSSSNGPFRCESG